MIFLFSTLTHDLAVLQRRVLLPLKKTEQSLPPKSSMCTKQIGMKMMKWVGEDIKLKNSQPKIHRLTLKPKKGAGEHRITLCCHFKDYVNFLENTDVQGTWSLCWTWGLSIVKISKYCYILKRVYLFLAFFILKKINKVVSDYELCLMSGYINMSLYF